MLDERTKAAISPMVASWFPVDKGQITRLKTDYLGQMYVKLTLNIP